MRMSINICKFKSKAILLHHKLHEVYLPVRRCIVPENACIQMFVIFNHLRNLQNELCVNIFGHTGCTVYNTYIQCESKKFPQKFSDIFPKRLGIFSPNFTCLLNVPIYAGLQFFIQLSATLMKLCHIKRDHHNVLKMSTIDRNAGWVVALNMG